MPLVDPKRMVELGRASAIGLEVALSVVLGLLGGAWLDRKLGTKPLLMFVGLVLGMIAAGRSLYRLAKGRPIDRP